jgi:molybdenum cofactor cytidylyltransferase
LSLPEIMTKDTTRAGTSPAPTNRDESVAAILLAAGRSERMGAFKPLLPFGDQTIVESCIDYLKRGGVETIVVVLGHRAEDVRKHLANSSVRFAVNPDPDSEMSASIACGVRELPPQAEATLIALVDQPAIPSEVVVTLVNEWKTTGGKLVVPEYQGRGGHPVLVDLSFREELLTLDPQLGLRALFDAHRADVRRVLVKSPFVARDTDTWDDYRALHKEVFGTEPPESCP